MTLTSQRSLPLLLPVTLFIYVEWSRYKCRRRRCAQTCEEGKGEKDRRKSRSCEQEQKNKDISLYFFVLAASCAFFPCQRLSPLQLAGGWRSQLYIHRNGESAGLMPVGIFKLNSETQEGPRSWYSAIAPSMDFSLRVMATLVFPNEVTYCRRRKFRRVSDGPSAVRRYIKLESRTRPATGSRAGRSPLQEDSYLVDPASSHMLVSKIKPCMSKYKPH